MFRVVLCFVLYLVVCGAVVFAQVEDVDDDSKESPKSPLIVESFDWRIWAVGIRGREATPETPTVFLLRAPTQHRPNLDRKVFDSITGRWLERHPKSKAIEVSHNAIYPGTDIDYAKATYIWVVDNENNLNIELVRQGACDAETMLLSEVYEDTLLLDRQDYEAFGREILEAERLAKEEKLGIWAFTESN